MLMRNIRHPLGILRGVFSRIWSGRLHCTGNPEILEVFPDRKSLISDIPGFPAVDRDPSIMFLTVY
jgi:hypothetical protein